MIAAGFALASSIEPSRGAEAGWMIAVLAISAIAWIGLCFGVRNLMLPWLRLQCGGDSVTGALCVVARLYVRILHRARFTGCSALRDELDPGSLIVIANHGAGIDPVLIQSAFRVRIRWMMAETMMTPGLDWLWRRERIIPVAFDRSDSGAAREAIRHVKAGGVLGVFPEGGIARPPETIQPFMAGVGVIVARTAAPVVIAVIRGTPNRDHAFESLFVPSRSTVDFLDVIRYPEGTGAAAIVEHLRRRVAEATGWEVVEGDGQGDRQGDRRAS